MSSKSRQRLWIITGPYYPEQISTGYFLTGIAECLTGVRRVGVVCSMRAPRALRHTLPRRETVRGVDVHRAGPRVGYPRSLPARSLIEGWMALAMFWRALRQVRGGDEMLVVTTPPFVPFLMRLVAWLRGAELDLLVHDVYPEVLAVTGVVRNGGIAYRTIDRLTRRLVRRCRRIIVLSEGMRDLVAAKLGGHDVPIHVVPNWGDVDAIRPRPRADNRLLQELGIADRFVVQYGGNIGRTHGAELLVEAATGMRDGGGADVHFLVIGEGSRRPRLEQLAGDRGLDNIRFLDRQPDDQFTESINACDLAMIMLEKGMAGVSVPSRMYNLLAAGRPLLIVADEDTEPARLARQEALGWVVPPGDADRLCEAIREARRSPRELSEMSVRARDVAVSRYSYASICALLREIYG